jgi:hypothetical protein
MIPVHDILRRDSLLQSFDGNGHAMFVGTADKEDILSRHPQKPHINISRNIDTGKVSDMDWAIGIRKG